MPQRGQLTAGGDGKVATAYPGQQSTGCTGEWPLPLHPDGDIARKLRIQRAFDANGMGVNPRAAADTLDARVMELARKPAVDG